DSRKAVNMFLMMKVPVLGIVENMSGLICPHCGKLIEVFKTGGGEKSAMEMNVPFLGAIPMDVEIGRLGDQGVAFAGRATAAADAFEGIVNSILNKLRQNSIIDR
ncbi:MAG TPA: P-loop NTPase, partial [Methanothrix sp.]|nr:P-loop NTPase [Methanothrix sp.]